MKAHEALGAAASVIAIRTEMAMLACGRPSAEASAEMALMVSEKMDAFAKSGGAISAGAADLAEHGALYATDEVAAASEGWMKLAACRTPAELFNVQSQLLTGWLNRTYNFGVGVNAAAAKTGEQALAPLHLAVTANDKRLRKT